MAEEDHVASLNELRKRLVEKRRALVKDAMVGFTSDSSTQKIAELQVQIEAIDRAIAEEEVALASPNSTSIKR